MNCSAVTYINRVICIISYLILVLAINHIQAQVDGKCLGAGSHDTISMGKRSLVIDVSQISLNHKAVYHYEEGFFITYLYIDSANLFIHNGHNTKRPFCDTTQIKLVSEDSDRKCYYGVINNLYTKEVYYKQSNVTISYVNVTEKDLSLFDGIISSIELIPNYNENKGTKK